MSCDRQRYRRRNPRRIAQVPILKPNAHLESEAVIRNLRVNDDESLRRRGKFVGMRAAPNESLRHKGQIRDVNLY